MGVRNAPVLVDQAMSPLSMDEARALVWMLSDAARKQLVIDMPTHQYRTFIYFLQQGPSWTNEDAEAKRVERWAIALHHATQVANDVTGIQGADPVCNDTRQQANGS